MRLCDEIVVLIYISCSFVELVSNEEIICFVIF